ncbi:hypothetical protein SASPL_149455 [Salvia splendens]|uniref:Uncharacterized protein n=1 Tax=Salvia splendens TaxID=180675 RepID=A0A8X8Z594_SALSN|nr:uncharacterized protein LOC121780265 [Salvia splendens]KAG6391697.1 hypothetical protein SASPL_149455 [Salvia splendens]
MEEVIKKRARDETEIETEAEEIDSPEVKRLRQDLLDGIDEDSDLCTSIHDLDSFMKSFEEEITASPASGHGSGAAKEGIVDSASDCGESGAVDEGIVELPSDSGESRPDLGYLLEASDDELGIPPPAASPSRKELVTVESDSSEFGSEFWEVDEFGFGFGGGESGSGEYVELDGLFDYSDVGFGSGDVVWRPETLPAQ